LVHQFADIFWAVVFFGLMARWTRRIRPVHLLIVAPFRVVASSFTEYYLILPWFQPLLRIQVPYSINLSVHLVSAGAYPVFLWLRTRVLGDGTVAQPSRSGAKSAWAQA